MFIAISNNDMKHIFIAFKISQELFWCYAKMFYKKPMKYDVLENPIILDICDI